jgi:membrane dipeptidase
VAVLRHPDNLIDQAAEDHVSLGSDVGRFRVPARIGDVTGMPRLFDAMRRQGYDTALVARRARDNCLGFLDRCLR